MDFLEWLETMKNRKMSESVESKIREQKKRVLVTTVKFFLGVGYSREDLDRPPVHLWSIKCLSTRCFLEGCCLFRSSNPTCFVRHKKVTKRQEQK